MPQPIPFNQLTIAQAQEVAARFQKGEPQHYRYVWVDGEVQRQFVSATQPHLSAVAGLAEEAC